MAKPYFEFDKRLKRYKAGKLSLPLGIVSTAKTRGRECCTYEFYPDIADTGEDQYCFAAVVDSARTLEVFESFFKYFQAPVKVVLTYLSYDYSRVYDNYRSRSEYPFDEVHELWKRFRQYFADDGTVGFGIINVDPLMELIIDEHKEIRFYCPVELFDRVKKDFEKIGVPFVDNYEPYFYHEHINRPILKTGGQYSVLMDEFDIRYAFTRAFNLELLIDEESQEDEQDKTLGDTPWFGVFRLGAKEGATRRGRPVRGGWVTMGLVARSYREAREFAVSEVRTTGVFNRIEWVMELYRVRDEHLDKDAREMIKANPSPGVHYVGEYECW